MFFQQHSILIRKLFFVWNQRFFFVQTLSLLYLCLSHLWCVFEKKSFLIQIPIKFIIIFPINQSIFNQPNPKIHFSFFRLGWIRTNNNNYNNYHNNYNHFSLRKFRQSIFIFSVRFEWSIFFRLIFFVVVFWVKWKKIHHTIINIVRAIAATTIYWIFFR